MTVCVTIDQRYEDDALAWIRVQGADFVKKDWHQDGYYTFDPTRVDFFFEVNSPYAIMFKLRWT